MQKLELHIPGLLAVPARLATQLELPGVPALREWQQRAATREVAPGRFGFVCELLAAQHAPLAELAWLGATGERSQGDAVLRATFVHFEAGMNDLVLFTGIGLDVSPDERARLAYDIGAFFDDIPRFELLQDHLFLRAPRPLRVRTTRIDVAQGKTVRANLPKGEDATLLHGWMNELQMFLHVHPLNRERLERGVPSINGIWLDGEGTLPSGRISLNDARVYAHSMHMRGLAKLVGASMSSPMKLEEMLPGQGHHIIEHLQCIEALDGDDVDAWRLAVTDVDANLLQPVLDWLHANPDADAVLHAGDGKVRALGGGNAGVMRKLLRRFRRSEALRVVEE